MIENEGSYYLYRHIRLDTSEPFYIGIGNTINNNSCAHKTTYSRAYTSNKRSTFWKNTVNQTPYEVEILLESNDYEFIKQKEIEFIALYGRRDLRKGTLVNLTDGGEGSLGLKQSKETIEKRTAKLIGRINSEKSIQKLKDSKKHIIESIKNKVEGKEYTMKQGVTVKIINYINTDNVKVVFIETGVERVCSLHQITSRRLKDYFFPSVCSIGYLGGEKYNKKAKEIWGTLLKNNKNIYGISEEWKNLQNFTKWFEEEYDSNKMQKWVLRTNLFNEKDIKCGANNCYFLPEDLSNQFNMKKGYSIRKDGKISTSFLGKHIAYFDTTEEAIKKYKEVKKEHILKISEKYKHIFSEELYSSILNYEIRIKETP